MKKEYYVKPEQAQVLKDLENLIGGRIKLVKGREYRPSNFAIIKDGDVVQLKLVGNNIQNSLPESIGNLASLTRLYLWGNNIRTLPESIGNLQSLKEIDLTNNQLVNIPETIGNLTSLKWLFLNGNNIITLPEAIGNLTSLTRLYLSGNNITILPEIIGNLKNLSILELNSNYNLSTLPKSFSNLMALKVLGLYNTPMYNPKNYDKTTEFVLNHLKEKGSIKRIRTPTSDLYNIILICSIVMIIIFGFILGIILIFNLS